MNDQDPQDLPWPLPYERPNQKWLCGGSAGASPHPASCFPCPLGPDARGRCQTTAECAPLLEAKPGEEKGRYRCTRRAEYGGPCAEGPLPSGACGRPLPPCAPVRSLRSRRALVSFWVLGVTVGALLLLLYGPLRFEFINPGPLSAFHAQPKGGQARPARFAQENCQACHKAAEGGFGHWAGAAAGASPHALEFSGLLREAGSAPRPMDAACAECHRGHQFHHVNLRQEQSCLGCHQEHRGDEGLRVKSDQACLTCHGEARRMTEALGGAGWGEAAAEPAAITRFSRDHPEFGPVARNAADPNTLRFNHQLHLSPAVKGADGRPLGCAACHQEDAAGEYQQRIRFARHCQSCHALQFDPETPELQLPHGEVEFVKAFLGSLPQQYEEFAAKTGLTERRAVRAFVEGKMRRLQERQVEGVSLEDEVFHARSRRVDQSGRTAPFHGCAYCHEVSGRGSAVALAKAEAPGRWLTKGRFQHRSHQTADCAVCHNAARSTQTRDILLPSVRDCVSCHRSNVAPGESCMLCHTYHHWRGGAPGDAAGPASLRSEPRVPRELGVGKAGAANLETVRPD